MKNFYLFFLITFFSISLGAQEKSNNVAYEDTNVRFTVISDGTIRMEYAPDGKFINQHSFLAVERNYPAVKFKLKKGAWIELSTSKMKLRYKKNSGAFTAENLQISSMKGLTPAFVWKPGMKQQYNLKGTTRTLDGWDGDKCWGHKADLVAYHLFPVRCRLGPADPQGKVPRRGHRPDRHLAGRPAPHRVCRLGGEGL